MNGETVTVVVAGQQLKLPLSMTMLRALGKAEVCPMYLANLAAVRGIPLAITLEQALQVIALGMVGCGVVTTPERLWSELRKRQGGASELNAAATTYLHAFLEDMPVLDAPAPPLEAAGGPKE